jgi:hypothetical protein
MTDDKLFDPRELPGAEVVYDGLDDEGDGVAVVAVPVSAFEGLKDLPPEVAELLAEGASVPDPLGDLLANFQQMIWALEEIDKAAERHGELDENGPVHSAFPLLACVGQPYMAAEEIFRAHCSEMLDRVATGADTQPPTKAEMLGLLVDASEFQDFCGGLTSLYLELTEAVLPAVFETFLKQELNGDRTDVDAQRQECAEDVENHRDQLTRMLTRPRERGGRGPLPEDGQS